MSSRTSFPIAFPLLPVPFQYRRWPRCDHLLLSRLIELHYYVRSGVHNPEVNRTYGREAIGMAEIYESLDESFGRIPSRIPLLYICCLHLYICLHFAYLTWLPLDTPWCSVLLPLSLPLWTLLSPVPGEASRITLKTTLQHCCSLQPTLVSRCGISMLLTDNCVSYQLDTFQAPLTDTCCHRQNTKL